MDDTWRACDYFASALVVSDPSTLRAGLPGLGDICNPGFLEDVLASSKALEGLPDFLRRVERFRLLEDVLASSKALEGLPDLLRRVERLRFLEDVLASCETLDALPDWCAAGSNGVHDFVLGESESGFPGILVTV